MSLSERTCTSSQMVLTQRAPQLLKLSKKKTLNKPAQLQKTP